MNKKNPVLFLNIILIAFTSVHVSAQKEKTDANIVGHVVSDGHHIPYANIAVKGTTLGTVTDETGHYFLVNVPVGTLTVVASSIGYKSKEVVVKTDYDKTLEIKFELEEDMLNLDEVVVSADRSYQKRHESPVIVNTLPAKLFSTTHAQTLAEGLNFCPGLRLENNCQNCGFTQVRMNGMEGPYTQILINSRPVFSSLAGVYGLEIIPSNMIERVEVVRGGGSAIYGGNAIAGTLNIILKEPVRNTYAIELNSGLTGVGMHNSGGTAPDYSVNFNTTLVSDDHKTGISLYGHARERKMFDANNDGFSEIAPMDNLTAGSRFFQRFGYRNKVSVDFFTSKEERDGGNRQEYPLHERDIAEAVKHNIKTGALTYDHFVRENDLLSVYASGQFLKRDSYYGANRSLNSYGHSKDFSYNMGVQYMAELGSSSLLTGIEFTGERLTDNKLGYPDFDSAAIVDGLITGVIHTDNILIADQSAFTSGVFAQYEVKLDKLKITLGGRFDTYEIKELTRNNQPETGYVFNPRISLIYQVIPGLHARAGYSKGYRAPQIFDEDLHTETSGSRQVIIENDPALTQETSHSITTSLDFHKLIGTVYTSFLAEAFYTRLLNPFVNEIGMPDETGTVIYTRRNAEDGATVKGLNLEMKLRPLKNFSLMSGATIQTAMYDVAQEFDERHFMRAPGTYGYFMFDWDFARNFCLSSSGTYTGPMKVPYFGPNTDPDTGELRISEPFFDLGIKIRHTIKLNGASLQWFAGIKNIFNSYQKDFDIGIDRDPSYIYGPFSPRTLYFGIKIGNMLN